MLYDKPIDPRIERSRYGNAVAYLDETQTGRRRHKVSIEIVAGQTIYDLKRHHTSEHIVRVQGGSLLRGWAISEQTGPAKCDQIELDLATLPSAGTIVDVTYYKNGQPDGVSFGRRVPIEIDEDTELGVFEAEGWERLFVAAGFDDVYNDPSWYWVFVDANPGLNGIWRSSLVGLPNGTELVYPSEAEVLIQLEGPLDE